MSTISFHCFFIERIETLCAPPHTTKKKEDIIVSIDLKAIQVSGSYLRVKKGVLGEPVWTGQETGSCLAGLAIWHKNALHWKARAGFPFPPGSPWRGTWYLSTWRGQGTGWATWTFRSVFPASGSAAAGWALWLSWRITESFSCQRSHQAQFLSFHARAKAEYKYCHINAIFTRKKDSGNEIRMEGGRDIRSTFCVRQRQCLTISMISGFSSITASE